MRKSAIVEAVRHRHQIGRALSAANNTALFFFRCVQYLWKEGVLLEGCLFKPQMIVHGATYDGDKATPQQVAELTLRTMRRCDWTGQHLRILCMFDKHSAVPRSGMVLELLAEGSHVYAWCTFKCLHVCVWLSCICAGVQVCSARHSRDHVPERGPDGGGGHRQPEFHQHLSQQARAGALGAVLLLWQGPAGQRPQNMVSASHPASVSDSNACKI